PNAEAAVGTGIDPLLDPSTNVVERASVPGEPEQHQSDGSRGHSTPSSDWSWRPLTPRERPRSGRKCGGGPSVTQHAYRSIPSSARASTDGGIARPSALAVLRLITKSNFVGCSTGRSEGGLSPRYSC